MTIEPRGFVSVPPQSELTEIRGLIETLKLYHYDVFAGVISWLTRLCW